MNAIKNIHGGRYRVVGFLRCSHQMASLSLRPGLNQIYPHLYVSSAPLEVVMAPRCSNHPFITAFAWARETSHSAVHSTGTLRCAPRHIPGILVTPRSLRSATTATAEFQVPIGRLRRRCSRNNHACGSHDSAPLSSRAPYLTRLRGPRWMNCRIAFDDYFAQAETYNVGHLKVMLPLETRGMLWENAIMTFCGLNGMTMKCVIILSRAIGN